MAPLFCVIMDREKERNDIFMVVGSVHAGHGGAKVNGRWTDSGAVGSGYQEADVARTITDKMDKIMKVRNVTDNTSRTSNDIIRGQAAGINASPNGYQISNHLNAFNGKATGVEVLYGSDSEKAMAAKLSAAIAKALGLPNRGAKDGKWLGIATMTGAGKKALLIEWGFIDNAGDMKKLMANMDKAIAEVCNILGYKATSNQKPSKPAQPSKPSTGATFAKGDTVTVLSKATHYQTGQPIASFVKGQKYKVKDVKSVSQSASKKAYLLEGINSWVLEQDLAKVSSGYKSFKKGDTVTVLSKATHYQTGQPIASFVKGQKYKVKDVKSVSQSASKKAYLLEGINSWVLEQDLS